MTWRTVDVRTPQLVSLLDGCDAVVHAVVPDVPGETGQRPDREAALGALVAGAAYGPDSRGGRRRALVRCS